MAPAATVSPAASTPTASTAATDGDRINALDGTADIVDCGAGKDTAIVDRHDTVRGCEDADR